MKRIIPLQFIGKPYIDFDLFDINGNLIYKEGTPLTPEELLKLSAYELYQQTDEELEKEIKDIQTKHVIIGDDGEEEVMESAISAKSTQKLLKHTKRILTDIQDGKTPSVAACEDARDNIIEEVKTNIEKVECIGQLRVFDEYTYSHTINVSSICSAIGVTLGFGEKDLEDLALGGLLHDVGKMKVPKEILNKPGKLTDEEFQIMKDHARLGYEVLTKEMNIPEHIAKVALEHQEKYGGFGYPFGLKGKEISLFAQVCSIADVYDALVSERVYKPAMPSHKAIKIMVSDGSKAFNPFILYKFVYLANYKQSDTIQITEEGENPLLQNEAEAKKAQAIVEEQVNKVEPQA